MVSASKAAPMLGLSPWDSPRAMWHKMKGDLAWDEENAAMERGNLCEPAVLAWWRKHNEHADWREQVTIEHEDWCLATPDALAVVDGSEVLIEAKTAAKMDDWGTPGTDEIPVHYLVQVYLAMHVANLNGHEIAEARIPVLGGYQLLFTEYVVPYSAEHGADILARCKAFHVTLDGDAPPLDDSVATFDAMKALHPEIDRGESCGVSDQTAHDLIHGAANLKAAQAADRLARSTALEAMGRAQYLTTPDGTRIARRQPRGEAVTFVVVGKPADLERSEVA